MNDAQFRVLVKHFPSDLVDEVLAHQRVPVKRLAAIMIDNYPNLTGEQHDHLVDRIDQAINHLYSYEAWDQARQHQRGKRRP